MFMLITFPAIMHRDAYTPLAGHQAFSQFHFAPNINHFISLCYPQVVQLTYCYNTFIACMPFNLISLNELNWASRMKDTVMVAAGIGSALRSFGFFTRFITFIRHSYFMPSFITFIPFINTHSLRIPLHSICFIARFVHSMHCAFHLAH